MTQLTTLENFLAANPEVTHCCEFLVEHAKDGWMRGIVFDVDLTVNHDRVPCRSVKDIIEAKGANDLAQMILNYTDIDCIAERHSAVNLGRARLVESQLVKVIQSVQAEPA